MIAKWSICLFLVKPSIFYCGVSNDMPTNSDDPWAICRKAVQEQRWRLAVAVTSDPSSLKKATGCSKRSLCSSAVSNKRCRVLAAQRGPDKGWSRNDPKYQVTLRPQAQCQEVFIFGAFIHTNSMADGERCACETHGESVASKATVTTQFCNWISYPSLLHVSGTKRSDVDGKHIPPDKSTRETYLKVADALLSGANCDCSQPTATLGRRAGLSGLRW